MRLMLCYNECCQFPLPLIAMQNLSQNTTCVSRLLYDSMQTPISDPHDKPNNAYIMHTSLDVFAYKTASLRG